MPGDEKDPILAKGSGPEIAICVISDRSLPRHRDAVKRTFGTERSRLAINQINVGATSKRRGRKVMPKDTTIDQELLATPEPEKLTTLTEESFESLRKRLRAVRAILALPDRTRVDVEAVAKEAGEHPATLYRDLPRLKGQGTIRDLAPEKRAFPQRRSRLHVRQEKWIQHFLKKEFLSVLP